jgi:hypothetical protein
MADRPKSASYGEKYFATDFMQTYAWNGKFWTSAAGFDAQQERERAERDRREFEREKRERPWWYEGGHHICGDWDGH